MRHRFTELQKVGDRIFAIGNYGTFLQYEGEAWVKADTGITTFGYLRAIAGNQETLFLGGQALAAKLPLSDNLIASAAVSQKQPENELSVKVSYLSSILMKVERGIFNNPRLSLSAILLLTVFFAIQIPALKMYSEFADLLPQKHPYIQLHNEVRDNFGGANNVIIAVEVDEGDIFNNDTLRLIDSLTISVDSLPSINYNLIKSLTHRTTRKVWLTSEGDINSEPYYDPLKEGLCEDELDAMRLAVKANPQFSALWFPQILRPP